eukprot:scaffold111783_cov63-Phaeocystis_antarctica.AAC.3
MRARSASKREAHCGMPKSPSCTLRTQIVTLAKPESTLDASTAPIPSKLADALAASPPCTQPTPHESSARDSHWFQRSFPFR